MGRRRLLLLGLLACQASAPAHDSPEHEIEVLNARLAAKGESAELLGRRATEWRALRRFDEAEADLKRATELEPESMALRSELARVQAAQTNYGAALATLASMLNLATEDSERAYVYMQRAEVAVASGVATLPRITVLEAQAEVAVASDVATLPRITVLEAQGECAGALEDCRRAFAAAEPQPDWYLTRGRLLWRAQKWDERARGLKEGFERTGSVVLEIEWIEAMIDAGQFGEALERIAPHLQRARWKSGWLIRKGRAELGEKRRTEARQSLQMALGEVDRRIKAGKLEVNLVAERGLANVLLGERAGAEAALREVRRMLGNSGVFEPNVDRLERLLAQ